MGTAFRTHLALGFFALVLVVIWTATGLSLPEVQSSDGGLEESRSDLLSGELPADEASTLALLMLQDDQIPLHRRLSWLGSVVDSRLRDAVQIPTSALEDGHALLALVLHPAVESEAKASCPEVPESVGVICDDVQWSALRADIIKQLHGVLQKRPGYAAAARVGGNDLSLQVADQLCRMGKTGLEMALTQIRDAPDEMGRVLGVLALGCAGYRPSVGVELQRFLDDPGALGVVSAMECVVRKDCSLSDTAKMQRNQSATDALLKYADQLGGRP